MTAQLILGTAMWGWTLSKNTCFNLLDNFYQAGFRGLDAATNYPINKKPQDFRKAEKWLLEWIKLNKIEDLEVIMKVGSINNRRSPDNNLCKSFLLIGLEDYLSRFGTNLDTFMIHWDNREQVEEIEQSMEAFQIAQEKGVKVGLSGIKHPEIYAQVNKQFQFDFSIQIKHNLLYSDYPRYPSFHGKPRFITYGINAGGLKLKAQNYTPESTLKTRGGKAEAIHPIAEKLQSLLQQPNNSKFQSFNDCGMCFAYHSPDIKGILIGPSNKDQLENTIALYKNLETGAHIEDYQKLKQISIWND